MSSLETLKRNLISDIVKSTNEVLLHALSDVFNSNSTKNTSLTASQVELIHLGFDDIGNGRVITEEELALEDAKWMIPE